MLFPQIHKFIFCIQISIFLITLPFLHSKVGEVYDNSLKIQSEKISRTLIFLCANKIEKNRTDSSIQPLLKIAYCLSPDESNTFLIQGLIEKGKKIPEELKSIKIDEGKFLQSLIQFTSKLKTNNRSLILWNLVQTLSPNNPTAAIALQSVKRKGISVNLENLIEKKSQKIPDSVFLPLYKPELPEEVRNKIVTLSSKLGRSFFQKDPNNLKIRKLVDFGRLIDSENKELILLEAQIENNLPITQNDFIIEEILLSYLKIASKRKGNSELLNFVLNSVILLIDSNNLESIASVQKAKRVYLLNSFNSIISEYQKQQSQELAKKEMDIKLSKNPKITRVINLQLADFLVQKDWLLVSRQTKEEWFFTFRKTKLSPHIGGNCQGRIGKQKHSWKEWKIVNEILIIDNYAKYKFLPKEKIWSPLERGNSTFLR